MGKFKIGDRVRFTRDNPNGGAHYGAKGEVVIVAGEIRNSSIYGDQVAITHPGHSWTPDAPISVLEVLLTIEAGKFYRMRDGRKVGPMKRFDSGHGVWKAPSVGGFGPYWWESGEFHIGEKNPFDLIAEWVDEPADAVAASNDNATKPKFTFKVGDKAKTRNGRVVTITEVDETPDYPFAHDMGGGRYHAVDPNGKSCIGDDESDIVESVTAPTNPAIVALIENGQPLPSRRPFIHADEASASKEAARLASKHKGQSFGVYVLTQTVKEDVVYTYKHEWQRLAANGDKIPAIKALREITGLGLKATKDAVEHWIANDQQYSRVAA